MFCRIAIAAFAGSLLPSLAWCATLTPGVTTSEDQYVYFAYYSTNDCSSLVGLFGSVALEEVEVVLSEQAVAVAPRDQDV